MRENPPHFTIVLDFLGGTYLYQVRASNPSAAIAEWLRTIDSTMIEGLNRERHNLLAKVLADSEPTLVAGLISVWCVSADLDDELALFNVIQTEEGKS